jgi:hypothetical protein
MHWKVYIFWYSFKRVEWQLGATDASNALPCACINAGVQFPLAEREVRAVLSF